jgi:hypothetical protein
LLAISGKCNVGLLIVLVGVQERDPIVGSLHDAHRVLFPSWGNNPAHAGSRFQGL